MPWKGNDFQYNRDEAFAVLKAGLYGEEYAEAVSICADIDNGVRKHWTDKLRALADEVPQDERAGMMVAARLLDPYNDVNGRDGSFGRTEVTGEGSWARVS